jgi:hypothetical protein
MKYQILNNEPIHFHNSAGELMGTISVSGSGDMIIRPESGSSRDIIIGDPNIAGDVQMGLVSAPINLELLGGRYYYIKRKYIKYWKYVEW